MKVIINPTVIWEIYTNSRGLIITIGEKEGILSIGILKRTEDNLHLLFTIQSFTREQEKAITTIKIVLEKVYGTAEEIQKELDMSITCLGIDQADLLSPGLINQIVAGLQESPTIKTWEIVDLDRKVG